MWSAMGSVMCIFEKNAYSANIECFILWGYLNNIVCLCSPNLYLTVVCFPFVISY